MTKQQSIQIASPSELVFEYLMNVENRKDYIPALEKVVMLDPLPIQLGSRYIEVAKIAGRQLETTYQVVRFEKNKLISAKTLKSVFPIQADLILSANGASTALTIHLDFELKGAFKLVAGLIGGIVDQQARDILRKIKSNLERA
jgi:uncharacterized membrane protein